MGKIMEFKPGQFVFVGVAQGEIGGETHPFSLASSGGKSIRLAIKMFGDYTKRLPLLKKGTVATLRGPFGRLGDKFEEDKNIVLIAGGIGITPFLAMIDQEKMKPRQRKIYLFYLAKNSTEAYGWEEIKHAADKLKNIKIEGWWSDQKGRIGAKNILAKTGNIKDCNYLICGAPKMMEQIRTGLIEAGAGEEQVEFEDFSLK